MERSYEPASAAEAEVVGLLAYSALAMMTRLAKDGDQAPTFRDHVVHARMSSLAFHRYEELEVWAGHRGFDLIEASEQFNGIFDDLEARTRPATWMERSIKTYVTKGILTDFLRQVTERHQLFVEEDDAWDFGQAVWVQEHLAPAIAADEQLAARLSLWARRVAGEVLGLVRSTLFTHPALAIDADTVDAVVASVGEHHGKRMAAIGLKA